MEWCITTNPHLVSFTFWHLYYYFLAGTTYYVQWDLRTLYQISHLNQSFLLILSTLSGKTSVLYCIYVVIWYKLYWLDYEFLIVFYYVILYIILLRFIQYNPTSLERNYKHDVLTEVDLGVPIDLILPETYANKDDTGKMSVLDTICIFNLFKIYSRFCYYCCFFFTIFRDIRSCRWSITGGRSDTTARIKKVSSTN